MDVKELPPLQSADFVRRWFLPYFTRGVLHRWSPSLWLADPRENDTKRLIPRFLLRDLEEYAYEFELPEKEDVLFLDGIRKQAGKEKRPDLLWVDLFGRRTLVLFDPDAIQDVLARSPNPFGPAPAKSRSMGYFQPDAVIVSRGPAFVERREFNERTLTPLLPCHIHAASFLKIVQKEIEHRLQEDDRRLMDAGKPLDWAFMEPLAERVTAQVVFGEADDAELAKGIGAIRDLEALMKQANVAALAPGLDVTHPDTGSLARALRKPHFERLYKLIAASFDTASQESLMGACPHDGDPRPDWHKFQVPQWLFAMKEGIGIHTLAVLGMLAAHEDVRKVVQYEVKGKNLLDPGVVHDLEDTERSVLETMRLVTSAPLLIRETEAPRSIALTGGDSITVPANTQLLVLNAYCNRDAVTERGGYEDAHRFVPGRWERRVQVDGGVERRVKEGQGPLSNQFGNGRQRCPGASLVTLLTTAMVAGLLQRDKLASSIDAMAIKRDDGGNVPFGFDHFQIGQDELKHEVNEPGDLSPLPEFPQDDSLNPDPGTTVPKSLVGTPEPDRYDYIVVGSGAGGGPLAVKLARFGWKVLLLEAGSDPGAVDGDALTKLKYRVPAFHPLASEDEGLRWDFIVDGDKERYYPRGSALGGSTAVNALITMRAPDRDWDDIAASVGDPGWNGANMTRYLKNVIRRRYAKDGDGWLPVELSNLLDVLQAMVSDPSLKDILLGAAMQIVNKTRVDLIGDAEILLSRTLKLTRRVSPLMKEVLARFGSQLPPAKLAPLLLVLRLLERDVNDPDNDWLVENGLFLLPMSTENRARRGPREYIVDYVEDARSKNGNLHVKTEALVTRVILDRPNGETRAVGVEYREGKRLYRADRLDSGLDNGNADDESVVVEANREVILCGGAFNTPQLLMLSGIGPEAELDKLPVGDGYRVELCGVGKNLRDRLEFTVVNELDHDLPVLDGATFEPGTEDGPLRAWQRAGRGLYATNGIALGTVLRSSQAVAANEPADLFLFGAPTDFRGYELGYSENLVKERNKFTWAVLKARTGNKGSVKLRSGDARMPPDIDFGNFNGASEHPDGDLEAIMEAVRFIRETMASERVGRHVQGEVWPCLEDDDLRALIRKKAWGHHACGTCKMGSEEDKGVVDAELRVHGVDRLRVVDASVFPKIPGFFIALPVYMVSEKAAEMILRSG